MATTIYTFKRIGPGRYEAIDPRTGTVAGHVSGSSNEWNAQRLDGTTINNRFPTKQAAASHTFYR